MALSIQEAVEVLQVFGITYRLVDIWSIEVQQDETGLIFGSSFFSMTYLPNPQVSPGLQWPCVEQLTQERLSFVLPVCLPT